MSTIITQVLHKVFSLHYLGNSNKKMKVSTYSVQISPFQFLFLSLFPYGAQGLIYVRQVLYIPETVCPQLQRADSSFVWCIARHLELTFPVEKLGL